MEIKNPKKKGKGFLIAGIAIVIIGYFIYLGINWSNYAWRPNTSTEEIPILAYHRVVPDDVKKNKYPDNKWVLSLSDFENQMEFLSTRGYQTISADQLEGWMDQKNEFLRKTVMLTFDDGDYELYYNVLPVLKKYNMKATAFLVGSDITETTPAYYKNERHNIGMDKINEIKELYPYLDFQSHTYDLHKKFWFYGIAYETDYDDLMKDFQANAKFGFRYLAYPYGEFCLSLQKAAKENGITMAFKFKLDGKAKRTDNKMEIPRIKITGDMTLDDFKEIVGGY